ncbi:hypothetical protein [Oceanisphaera sp. IT1-181]|uniref:hypothetical protein n=1 Tax=Oceanisphaera sp. IT1-181 TaxID=3081199 RepID=UPI0029CA9266|nr:hypothetical protein [Oceanisphaera sp. IT1-181]
MSLSVIKMRGSLRPKIIGPTAFRVVDAYAHQEEEKALAEDHGKKFTDYTITRSAKPHWNVLPYYIAKSRSKNDPLAKSAKLKHHHIYLQPHDSGLYVFMTAAQPANKTISKQILVENLLVWDANSNSLDVFTHPLTNAYVNSFTLDMLKSSESSKTSVFTKLAKLMVEN